MTDLYINIFPQLIIALIVIPIIFGGLNSLIKNPNLSYLLTLSAAFINFFITCSNIILRLDNSSTISYVMGNWPIHAGIELYINQFNSLFLLMLNFTALSVLIFGKKIIEAEINKQKLSNFYACFLICIAGFTGILLTNDLFNLYVFIEISSLASYALLSISNNRKSLKFAFDYLIIGTLAATFILIGICFLYSVTGTLNISIMHAQLSHILHLKIVQFGIAIFLIGALIKSALFPFHYWMVNSYNYSSSFIVTFFAAVSTKIGIYILIRIIYSVLGTEYIYLSNINLWLQPFLTILASIAMIFGGICAIYQNNLRSMLIYSSVSQIGFIILALSRFTEFDMNIAMMLIINHLVSSLGLFMTCEYICYKQNSLHYLRLNLLAKSTPGAVLAFLINAICIIGLPVTLGFWAKFDLIKTLIQNNSWFILVIVLIASSLSIVYFWRPIENFYFLKPNSSIVISSKKSIFAETMIGIITLLNIGLALGFYYYDSIIINSVKALWLK
jgi:multicomponent Na+:H+ antiporter subunit D